MSEGLLSRKVSRGIIWLVGSMVIGRGLYFVSSVIVARLLDPLEFGLMAVAMAMLSLIQGVTLTGFDSALIQKQEKPEEFLNVAWTFELIRHLLLFLILVLAAPLFAFFFNEPRLSSILRVMAFLFIFNGLRNIGIVYFRKNLDFHKQFVMDTAPVIVNILVIVPLAFTLRNVWALVWASLASRMAFCMISYVMHPYRPHLDFEIGKGKELFNFGKWILGTSMITMVREQGVTMFVGRVLGMSNLGFYNRAWTFSSLLFRQMVAIIWKIGYPLYSQLQFDSTSLSWAYIKTLKLLTFFGMPIAGCLFILSRDFTHLFLTDKWLPIVPLLQILCLQSIVVLIITPAGILFQASGRPSITTKASAFGLIILAILVYPLSARWGMAGTAFSFFLSFLLPSPIVLNASFKMADQSLLSFIKSVLFPLINTAFTAYAVFMVKIRAFSYVGTGSFFGLIFLGIIVYLTIAYFLDRFLGYGVYRLIRERLGALA